MSDPSGLNPYRSTVFESPDSKLVVEKSVGFDLTERQIRKLRSHSLICAIPFTVLAAFVAVSGCIAMWRGEPDLLTLVAKWRLPAWLSIGLILPVALLFPVGVSLANQTIKGHRFLVWVGAILFFLGGSGAMGILTTVSGGQGLFGLAQLFGASCYASLLTGFAVFAIIFRGVAKRCRFGSIAKYFELTIPCLGLAAVSVSALVMVSGLDAALQDWLAFASYAIVVAVVVYAISLFKLSFGLDRLSRDGSLVPRSSEERRLSSSSRND
ncbi:MAG: hypothetical protein AAF802_29195 [Planctomycetota bacterium]